MKKIYYLFLLTALIGMSCTVSSSDKSEDTDIQEDKVALYPEIFGKGLAAHGGIDKWNSFQTVSYVLNSQENKQEQLIDLHTRKVRITDSLFVLGFDGEQVWVEPNLKSFGNGSARFYHNLYFYFFAAPYVLADPGIKYEDLGEQTISGKTYHAVKISYNQGVGDSPKDYYVAHFNPDTYLMELLLYTVTYYSKEAHEKYNALVYEWQEIDGLQVTKSMKGYIYNTDSSKLGDLRYEAQFEDVKFSKEVPANALFDMPEIAEIDSLR